MLKNRNLVSCIKKGKPTCICSEVPIIVWWIGHPILGSVGLSSKNPKFSSTVLFFISMTLQVITLLYKPKKEKTKKIYFAGCSGKIAVFSCKLRRKFSYYNLPIHVSSIGFSVILTPLELGRDSSFFSSLQARTICEFTRFINDQGTS